MRVSLKQVPSFARHVLVTAYIDTYMLHISFHCVLNNHCTLRQVLGTGRIADTNAPTGCEPSVFTQMSFINFSVFRKSRITSIFGFAECLATTPLDLEINDEQTTELLASPLLHRSEKQVETDHKFIHLKEKTWYPTRPDFNPAR